MLSIPSEFLQINPVHQITMGHHPPRWSKWNPIQHGTRNILLRNLYKETSVQPSRLSPNPKATACNVISGTITSRSPSLPSLDLRAETSTRFKNQTRINSIDPFWESSLRLGESPLCDPESRTFPIEFLALYLTSRRRSEETARVCAAKGQEVRRGPRECIERDRFSFNVVALVGHARTHTRAWSGPSRSTDE